MINYNRGIGPSRFGKLCIIFGISQVFLKPSKSHNKIVSTDDEMRINQEQMVHIRSRMAVFIICGNLGMR